MNPVILKNLTLKDLPSSWAKQFHSSPRQRFTVHIIAQIDEENQQNNSKSISTQQERIAFIRFVEQQLKGTESEDSEKWVQWIKETRTVSKPTQVF